MKCRNICAHSEKLAENRIVIPLRTPLEPSNRPDIEPHDGRRKAPDRSARSLPGVAGANLSFPRHFSNSLILYFSWSGSGGATACGKLSGPVLKRELARARPGTE